MSRKSYCSFGKIWEQCLADKSLPTTFMSKDLPLLCQFVKNLDRLACEDIKELVVKRVYKRGECIRPANAKTRCIWLIIKGIAFEELPSDHKSIIWEFHFIGELMGHYNNYVNNAPNYFALKALKKMECWEIPCDLIAYWYSHDPDFKEIVNMLTNDSLLWHTDVLPHFKQNSFEKGWHYLKTNLPQYQALISEEKLALFFDCSSESLRKKLNSISN